MLVFKTQAASGRAHSQCRFVNFTRTQQNLATLCCFDGLAWHIFKTARAIICKSRLLNQPLPTRVPMSKLGSHRFMDCSWFF